MIFSILFYVFDVVLLCFFISLLLFIIITKMKFYSTIKKVK